MLLTLVISSSQQNLIVTIFLFCQAEQSLIFSVNVFLFFFFSDMKDLVLANDKRLLKIGLGVVTVAGVGFLVYKVVQAYNK